MHVWMIRGWEVVGCMVKGIFVFIAGYVHFTSSTFYIFSVEVPSATGK